jgi:predicted ArsR family transcriptional regulator
MQAVPTPVAPPSSGSGGAAGRQDEHSGPHLDDLLHSPVRRRIVDVLSTPGPLGSLPELTAAQIAQTLGQHVTTARFHLDQLVAGRLLASSFRRGRVGRPRKLYRLRQGTLAEVRETGGGSGSFAALAELLTGTYAETTERGRPVRPEEAGRRWLHRQAGQLVAGTESTTPARTAGAWLGKLGTTIDLLERWGYTPELTMTHGGATAELTLADCPFLALAEQHPDVVCGIHRGLLRGAMEVLGEPDVEIDLDPLVTPTTCTASLRRTQGFGPVRSLHPLEEEHDD